MTNRERLGSWHGGKGDRDRGTKKKKYNEGYERIFGNKKEKRKEKCQQQKNK